MNRWLLLSIGLFLASCAVSAGVYVFAHDRLPEKVPIHWGWDGQPDNWVDRDDAGMVYLLWPGMLAGWVLLTVALPWLSPKSFKVEPFRRTYDYVMALAACFFFYAHAATLVGTTVLGVSMTKLMFAGLFLFLALLGNVLGKVRRNFWVGVRTPWTLASDEVWIRTHRLAAWLFTAAGVFGFVAVLLDASAWVWLPGLFVAAFVPIVYSLVLYKKLERSGKLGPPEGPVPSAISLESPS